MHHTLVADLEVSAAGGCVLLWQSSWQHCLLRTSVFDDIPNVLLAVLPHLGECVHYKSTTQL